MNKRVALGIAIGVISFVLVVMALVFVVTPIVAATSGIQPVETGDDPGIVELAQTSDRVDLNEENGIAYVDDEIVAFARQDASQEQVQRLADSLGAGIDSSMADVGIYKLTFAEPKSYDDLVMSLEKIEADPAIEKASLNPVSNYGGDDEVELEARAPVYPDDPWGGDVSEDMPWSELRPWGNNWGMEAINASKAWGRLDQLRIEGDVRLGLIDSMPDTSHSELDIASTSSFFVDDATGKTELNKHALAPDDHGTHVAGIMDAAWNNADGVSGLSGGKGEIHYAEIYYETPDGIEQRYHDAYTYILALKSLIDQDVRAINISQNTSRLIGFAASHGNQNAMNHLNAQADLAGESLSRIVERRQAEGRPDFVICVAAGNSNNTPYFRDPNATYGYREDMNDIEQMLFWLFGFNREQGDSLALYNNFLNLIDEEEVRDRIIVVGSVGIDKDTINTLVTHYRYSNFSNVGSRVDVVAPGEDIYSCVPGGYDLMSGTSMATPHVTGLAGLVFATNPTLSGPEVKEIIANSTKGRYYYKDGHCGMVNAGLAVENGLKTEQRSVNLVLEKQADDGLDLCFVVDTTSSMGDDIANARENMTEILSHLSEKTENYRVALVDYRDFSDRTGTSADYASRVELNFTNDNGSITAAIEELSLGDGGDSEETVYSALMTAVGLDWREEAKKAIIILGDAGPLDPEPHTDYTYEQVLLAIFNADISIDYDASDSRVTEALDSSLINVYSIGTDPSDSAAEFFRNVAESTGGSYADVDDASGVSDAINDSIEQIEIREKYTVTVDFGKEMASQKVDLYSDMAPTDTEGEADVIETSEAGKLPADSYLYTVETDSVGKVLVESMEPGTYLWTSASLYEGGTIQIEEGSTTAQVNVENVYWFTPLANFWHQNATPIAMSFVVLVSACVLAPLVLRRVNRARAERDNFKGVADLSGQDGTASVLWQDKNVIPVLVGSVKRKFGFESNRLVKQDTAPSLGMHFCPKCGEQCPPDAVFCRRCGTRLRTSDRTPSGRS